MKAMEMLMGLSIWFANSLSMQGMPVLLISLLYLCLSHPLWDFISMESVYMLSPTLFSYGLIIMSVWVVVFMLVASASTTSKKFTQIAMALLLILMCTFKTSSLMMFYLLFETSLLPILLMILGWGYQPERLNASLNLVLYTVSASLPLLTVILYLNKFWQVTSVYDLLAYSMGVDLNHFSALILTISVMAGFLVKFPMYAVHLWLPKAHVEAPVAGSMVLAAILLKLGGYGMILVSPSISSQSILTNFFIQFSLLGGATISILCLRQTDIKVLIAYSSVAHMSLAISSILTQSFYGILGAYLVLIAHGVTSSGMFMGANLSYERWKSRNMLMAKSFLNYAPIFSFFWFLLCMGNMGAPPSLNLLSEIVSIIALLNMNFVMSGCLLFIAGLAVAYTLILYAGTQQGQSNLYKTNVSLLSLREMSLSGSHVFVIFSVTLIIYLFY